MRSISICAIFLALACYGAWAQTEPVWTAVPMPIFVDYSTNPQPSQAGSGPYNLLFSLLPAQSPVNDALGCYWNNFAGNATANTANGTMNPTSPTYPYWYSGSTRNSGPIPRDGFSGVDLVFEDPVEVGTAMKGVSFLGTYNSGTVQGGGDPIAAVFWESDVCADGDTEYGFSFQTNAAVFYYSYWSNCFEGSCYLTDDTSTPVTQCGGGFTFPTLPPSTSGQYYYNAFPFLDNGTWKFRAEALDGGNYAPLYTCDVDPSSASPFSCSSPPPFSQNNVTALTPGAQATACTVVPPGNANTSFNPGWTYGVYGSLWAVIAGGSTSPYVSVNGVDTVPFQISVVKAGK